MLIDRVDSRKDLLLRVALGEMSDLLLDLCDIIVRIFEV
jgi:hypothetical protein